MDSTAALSLGIFGLMYAAIIHGRLNKTLVALAAAMLVLLFGLLRQDEAFAVVDWNVIFLLAGMMVIADVLAQTGLFDWLAARALTLTRARPLPLLLLLATTTAIASAFLDNVTTILLVAPLTLRLTARLQLDPVPFLVVQVLAANIGGTATLIGDPPNIIIGSAAGLGFAAFLQNLAPLIVLIFVLFTLSLYLLWRKRWQLDAALRQAVLIEASQDEYLITDRSLLIKGLVVLAVTIVGFFFHNALHYEAATIALSGAVLLLLLGQRDIHAALRAVEWATLLFFVALFIVVEAVVRSGTLSVVAEAILQLGGGNAASTTLLLLWLSGLASGVVDNIPYTVTMVPVIKELGQQLPAEPLWWALALGACLGGNLTLVGASANVVAASIAEAAGQPISFLRFLKYGVVCVVGSLLVASAYLWFFYLR